MEEVESNRKEKHNIIIVVPVSKSGVPKLKLNSGPKASTYSVVLLKCKMELYGIRPEKQVRKKSNLV